VLLSDLVQFGSDVQVIISSLPILYFVVNAIAIFYIIKHYFWNKDNLKILAASNQAASPNYELFCRTYSITDREMQIILLVADGMSNQAIGETLYISLNTVRNHIYNAYKKIGIKSRYELISILNSV
jgi:DNA-binding CsgD family transcriptional regulator